ncbi:hypothetical protein HGM15179_020670 [Zosterops borbonicus]|uniref:Uncharacterized protein n=1 Tax=Zosterops borbonicus TaxID=364589 RepID=A0A8K1D7I8_9PASS|nr:hypothetical protein HGM15179_020670 [Zosterops borbonicus]
MSGACPSPVGVSMGVSHHCGRLQGRVPALWACQGRVRGVSQPCPSPGVLPEVEDYFGIGDSSSGLLQTVFISSYLVLAPLFGFLGDRHSRKRLLALGLGLWSGVTLATSFVPPQVTPVLGLVALLLLVAVVSDPPRGGLETPPATAPPPPRAWGHDLAQLARNRTLVLSTLGFTAVAFVTGALALWAPAFLFRVRLARGEGPPCRGGRRCQGDESLLFGALTCGSGVLGVGLGAELSRRLRPRHPRADPLLCAGGLLGGAPCLLLALLCAQPCPPVAYVFIFVGETLLSLNWAIVADILLYVVPPSRRSTAEALQIVASHLLGDAGSPYLVGLVSDPNFGILGSQIQILGPNPKFWDILGVPTPRFWVPDPKF